MLRRRLLSGIGAMCAVSGCAAVPGRSPAPESEGPVRGEAAPILGVERTESRATVEYVEGENAVRYLARQGGGAGEYETTPWEQWARTQCVSGAKDPAIDTVSEELGISVGGGVQATSVSVAIETVVEDNRVVREPEVEFEDLVAATPRTVRVTYTLDSETYTDDVDVYAEHRVITRL